MPLALVLIALLLFVTAIRGNVAAAGAQFNQTFFGSNGDSGFLKWAGSVIGLAVIFRLIQAPKAGEMFVALVLLVYLLTHSTVLSQIDNAIQGQGAQGGQNSLIVTPQGH